MITLEDYFGRMSHATPPSDEIRENAEALLLRVNGLCAFMGIRPTVNSGWRTPAYNATVPNASPTSKHMTGQAIDLGDPDGSIDQYLFDNQNVLETFKLWLEHPASTRGWSHCQSVPPKSGNRVFFP